MLSLAHELKSTLGARLTQAATNLNSKEAKKLEENLLKEPFHPEDGGPHHKFVILRDRSRLCKDIWKDDVPFNWKEKLEHYLRRQEVELSHLESKATPSKDDTLAFSFGQRDPGTHY
jgi:hypothetical protein